MKRFHITRDLVFFLLLFTLLGAMTVFVSIRRADQDQDALRSSQPYSSYSAESDGMLALHNWLDTLGFPVQRIENTAFRIGDEVRFMYIVAPSEPIDGNEALYLLDWVKRGSTLYFADNGLLENNALLEQLDVSVTFLENRAENLTLSQPLADTAITTLSGTSFWGLETRRTDMVPYLGTAQPILLRIAHGQGTVWLSADEALLDNASLTDEDNAKLALGVLGNLPRGAVIAFDEYHHGLKGEQGTFVNAVYNTPWGWGLIFALLLGFGYAVLNGKRFGRTIPVQRTLALRTPSEYVVSMANLFRRANKRGMVLQHYRHALKRRLGRAFHLNPDMSDDHYLEQLSRMRPELDRAELTRILNNLRRAETTEIDLIKSIEQSVTFGTRKSGKT